MKFGDFIGLYEAGKSAEIRLEIEGVGMIQVISKDARPIIDGIKDWYVACFSIEDNGSLYVVLEEENRPF